MSIIYGANLGQEHDSRNRPRIQRRATIAIQKKAAEESVADVAKPVVSVATTTPDETAEPEQELPWKKRREKRKSLSQTLGESEDPDKAE